MSVKSRCISRLAAPPPGGERARERGVSPLGGSVRFVEEARLGAGVAGGTGRLHAQQHRVRVAIEPGFDYLHPVSPGASLLPPATPARGEPPPPSLAASRSPP